MLAGLIVNVPSSKSELIFNNWKYSHDYAKHTKFIVLIYFTNGIDTLS